MTTSTAPAVLPGTAAGRSQATTIEQSRATAEVFAAVLAAKREPRNEQAAIRRMADACTQPRLAERAFYRYNRGGEDGNVSGASIHLARELARCWGNVHYAVMELDRDDTAAVSEMLALAWDLEGNTRSASGFLVPHARDTKRGRKTLTALRDIYENNANNGARRLREAIFALLPIWFVEDAKERCRKTLEDGGGVPLPQRIAKAIDMFDGLGVSESRVVTKLGRQSSAWTPVDLGALTVIYQSIKNGEVTVDEEFPPVEVLVRLGELAATPRAELQPAKRRTRRAAADEPAEQPAPTEPPVEDAQVVADFFAGETGGQA